MNDSVTQTNGMMLEVQSDSHEVAPLTIEQLALIAGGECVVNAL